MYDDDDLLPISSLQHLAFCERQWALIHMEGEWQENVLTVEGRQLHEYVHEQGASSRDGVRSVRGLRLRSHMFGLYGVADLVEFHPDQSGVPVPGLRGTYAAYPVEYKRGRKRFDRADEIQLCAQAVCLEEMLAGAVPEGAVFYGQPRRRAVVAISGDLRDELTRLGERARMLLTQRAVPAANVGGHCKSCSLSAQCMPGLVSGDRSAAYVAGLRRELR